MGCSRILFLGLLTLGAVPQLAAAQASADSDEQPASSRVGAVIFYDYSFRESPKGTDEAGNTISPNAFAVTRAYVNVTGRISRLVSYRITPDINSTRFSVDGSNGLNGSLVFRLKYAYAEMNVADWTGDWTGAWVRFGIHATPLIGFQDSIYRYRFQGTVFTERDGGMASSDAGISFHANTPNDRGDFHVGLYNGEGYRGAESNDQKALMARGTWRPMPTGGPLARGLRLTGYYYRDHYLQSYERRRVVGSVSLEHPRYTLMFDYITRADQSRTPPDDTRTTSDGYSIVFTPFLNQKGDGWEALLRYDSFRPDANHFSTRRQHRTIAGVAYWFPHPGGSGTAALLFDYESVRYRDFLPARTTQRTFTLHGLINF